MGETNLKPFIILFFLILILVTIIIAYNQYIVKPIKKIQEQNKTIGELQKNITQLEEALEKNQTITKTKVIQTTGFSSILGWILFFICLVIIGYLLLKQMAEAKPKNMEEITNFLRGIKQDYSDSYIFRIEYVKLFRRVKYYEGAYKGTHKFPMALIIFCTNKDWQPDLMNGKLIIEPPKTQLFGILINRMDLKDIIETFDQGDKSCEEMLEAVKKTHWGMRAMHYVPYETPNIQQEMEQTWQQMKMGAEQVQTYQKMIKEGEE